MPWLGNSGIIWVIQKNQKDVMSTASRTRANAKKIRRRTSNTWQWLVDGIYGNHCSHWKPTTSNVEGQQMTIWILILGFKGLSTRFWHCVVWNCKRFQCEQWLPWKPLQFHTTQLNPNIKIQIFICCPFTFSVEVVRRSCWSINKIHFLWSCPWYSWPLCFIKHWYYEEKFEANHS